MSLEAPSLAVIGPDGKARKLSCSIQLPPGFILEEDCLISFDHTVYQVSPERASKIPEGFFVHETASAFLSKALWPASGPGGRGVFSINVRVEGPVPQHVFDFARMIFLFIQGETETLIKIFLECSFAEDRK